MKLKRLAISEEGFVFDPETGNSYTVNETGLLILKKLREGLSLEEIAEIMNEEYGISREEALRDIQDFLEAMARFGLWEEKYG